MQKRLKLLEACGRPGAIIPAGFLQSCLVPSHRSAKYRSDLDVRQGPPHSCTPGRASKGCQASDIQQAGKQRCGIPASAGSKMKSRKWGELRGKHVGQWGQVGKHVRDDKTTKHGERGNPCTHMHRTRICMHAPTHKHICLEDKGKDEAHQDAIFTALRCTSCIMHQPMT